MPSFVSVAATDPRAVACLERYFAERAETFPGGTAGYRTVWPGAGRFTPPAGEFLVLVDDGTGEPVGCGGVRSLNTDGLDTDGIRRYEVKHLWVSATARGRGLGRALLAELERRAEALGATELVLDTNASLAAAGGLYRANGYAEIPPYNENPNATNWYRKPLAR